MSEFDYQQTTEDKTLSYSINQLTSVLHTLKNCNDLKCIHDEVKDLLKIVVSYHDFWERHSENVVVYSIKVLINSSIDAIAHNHEVNYSFKNKKDANLIQKIKINIEQISRLIGVNRDVIFDMDTTQDAEIALREYNQINRLNLKLDELHLVRQELEDIIDDEQRELFRARQASIKAVELERKMEEYLMDLRRQSELRKRDEEATRLRLQQMKDQLRLQEEKLSVNHIQGTSNDHLKFSVLDQDELEDWEVYSGEEEIEPDYEDY